MIALDPNVLVRILVDDPEQPQQVDRARKAVALESQVWLSQIVLVETVWVLLRAYGFGKADIIQVLEHLFLNQAFVLEQEGLFEQALAIFRTANVDFSDALILVNAQSQGVSLLTFDRKLIKLTGAVEPSSV